MKKIHNKQLQNIISSFIAIVMIFGVLATMAYAGGVHTDTYQELILEVLDLSETQRVQFVDDVLAKLTESNYANYADYVDRAKDILGMQLTDSQMQLALESYANYPDKHKSTLNELLKSFELPELTYDEDDFPNIRERINYLVTGDSSNDKGFKLFVALIKNLRAFNSKPVFYDAQSNERKLDIRIDGNETLKDGLDKLIDSIDSLKQKDVSDFDSFITRATAEINANSDREIYLLKSFIKEELGASAYAGNLPRPVDPLQKVLLGLSELELRERVSFVNKILAKVTTDNYADYINDAKGILKASISDLEMGSALKLYASLSNRSKGEIEWFIKAFDLTEAIDTTAFPKLAKDINYEVTGDPHDDKGVKFVVKALDLASTITGKALVTDNSDNKFKIEFIELDNQVLEDKLNNLISLIKSLKDKGATDFDSFLAEAEYIVNQNDDIEIYHFKKYLKTQYGSSVYAGTLPNPGAVEPTPTGSTSRPPVSTPRPVEPTPTPTGGDIVEPKPTPTMPAAPPFSDIEGHWAADNIIKLVDLDIVNGYPDGTVKPDANITRAEMAVIVVIAAGLEPAEKITMNFGDLEEIPAWAIGFVQTGVDKGIIHGYEDNTFRASNNLTREEMVVLIMQAFGHAGSENTALSFLDDGDIGGWSRPFIVKSVEKEFVAGYPDNTFLPKKNVTRAEAFTVLIKAIEEKIG